jgi:LuxR family maltose regulon positive regulatory protein
LPDTLLTTKFFIPALRKGLVPRSRLLKVLNKSLDLPVTILTAPPGFGKTTLLAEWIRSLQETAAAAPIGCAWLSLDGEDNTLARFWTYAVTSLENAIPPSPQAPALSEIKDLLASSAPPFQVFLTILINQLSQVPQPLLLVLDDFHTILDAAVADSLAFLVDHSPPNLHVVISSRTDPPLPVGRWRARGQVNSLRAQDLRFTLDEAAKFLNGSMGLPLSRENMEELDQRTEGWAAGLQMAAFALQDQDGPGMARSISAFSGRHHVLLDYFSDEVLQRQPPRIQRFLLHTSVLDRMCAGLCAAVLDGSQDAGHPPMTAAEAQAQLEYLERANLFVVSLDTERRWYRYHHLFADLLRARLREAVGLAGEADLLSRASRWHLRDGYLAEAVNLALQARDFDLAASIMESPAQSMRIWESGEVAVILKWTQELPPEVTRKHLWLRLYQSRSLFYTGQADAAEEIVNEIEQEIRRDPGPERGIIPQKEMLLGMVLSHKARYASLRDQATTAREIARHALEVLPPAEIGARSFVFPTLALSAYRMGDAEEAARLFEETAQTTRRAGSRFSTLGNMTNLAVTRLSQGMLNESIRITRLAIQEGMIHGVHLPESGWPCYPLAEALYEQNHLEEAAQTITEGLRLVEEGKLTNYFGQMPAVLARIQMALGRVDEAGATMEAALAAARRSTVAFYISEIEAYQARLWVQMGDLRRALVWAEAYQARPKAERLCEIEEITLGEVLQAAGQSVKARDRLLPLGEDARRRGRGGREIQIRLILALCAHDLGDHQTARADLERAIHLGAPEGYMRAFLNLGEPLRRLIAAWLLRAVEPNADRQAQLYREWRPYVDHLCAVFPQPRTGPSGLSIPESLTPRELQVLQLLCQGLSNQEIADHFVLSLPTVKKHIGNIFGKLEVTSRTQAAARARDLGLV